MQSGCHFKPGREIQPVGSPIKLEHLSAEQKQKLLREECNAFAFDENNVGRIPSLNMHISLHDKTPVQNTYISVPKPLLQKVKEYL